MKRSITAIILVVLLSGMAAFNVSAKKTSVHIVNVPLNATSVRVNFSQGKYIDAVKQNNNGFWSAKDAGEAVSQKIESVTIVIDGKPHVIPRDILKIGVEAGGTVKISLQSFSTTTATSAAPSHSTLPDIVEDTSEPDNIGETQPTAPPLTTVTQTHTQTSLTTVTFTSAVPDTVTQTETVSVSDTVGTVTATTSSTISTSASSSASASASTVESSSDETQSSTAAEEISVTNADDNTSSPDTGSGYAVECLVFLVFVLTIGAFSVLIAKLKKE